MVMILANFLLLPIRPEWRGQARIMTMHHCVATTEQILDMVGPYRVSGEPTVLYFIWFHVDGVKLWDTTLFHLYVAGGALWSGSWPSASAHHL